MSETTDPRGRTAAEIEQDVERSRARVTETVEALRDSVSPNQLVEQALDYARSSGGADFMRNLGTSVRDNPLPVVMIGAGIGWLLLSGQNRGQPQHASAYRMADEPAMPLAALPAPRPMARPSPLSEPQKASGPGLGEKMAGAVSGAVASVKDAVSDTAASAGDTASRLGQQASATAGTVQDGMRRQRHDAGDALSQGYDAVSASGERALHRARDGMSRLGHEQPLLVGALGLAVGALFGALLPRTQTEDRLMGESSDAITHQITEVAQEQYEQAKEVVGDKVEDAKEALTEAYGETRRELEEKGVSAQSVGERLTQAGAQVTAAVTGTGQELTDAVREKTEPKDAAGTEAHPGPARQPGSPGAVSAASTSSPDDLKKPNISVPPKV